MPVIKLTSASSKSFGFSTSAKCEAFSSMMRSAFGHVSLMNLASDRGVALSSAPVISNIGAVISGNCPVMSKSRTAIVAATYPSIGVFATMVRIASTIKGCVVVNPSAYQRVSNSVNIDVTPCCLI